MDELLIEDKKYVSSRRAAKITGYAKDYIGQLCREGRVPARLVGRSWYVLETAIQDHRFGLPAQSEATDIQPEESAEKAPEPIISSTREFPRYESSTDEVFLPSVNRLKTDEIAENDEELTDSERLQDTWKTWFDRIADAAPMSEVPTQPVVTESVGVEEAEEKIEEEKPVDVPIHTVYRQPPEELLPRRNKNEEEAIEQEPTEVVEVKVKRGWGMASIRAIQACSVLVAVIAVSLALIGSGYLDEYIISNSQARIIAGVGLYNR